MIELLWYEPYPELARFTSWVFSVLSAIANVALYVLTLRILPLASWYLVVDGLVGLYSIMLFRV